MNMFDWRIDAINTSIFSHVLISFMSSCVFSSFFLFNNLIWGQKMSLECSERDWWTFRDRQALTKRKFPIGQDSKDAWKLNDGVATEIRECVWVWERERAGTPRVRFQTGHGPQVFARSLCRPFSAHAHKQQVPSNLSFGRRRHFLSFLALALALAPTHSAPF